MQVNSLRDIYFKYEDVKQPKQQAGLPQQVTHKQQDLSPCMNNAQQQLCLQCQPEDGNESSTEASTPRLQQALSAMTGAAC